MNVWLNVPYDEISWAKSVGANYHPIAKRWFVSNPKDLTPFSSWINPADYDKLTDKIQNQETCEYIAECLEKRIHSGGKISPITRKSHG